MSKNPTPTDALAALIDRLRAVADDLEAEREGRPTTSALGEALTFDSRALSLRIPETLVCGGCREIRFDARIDAEGFCPTCAADRLTA